jgi:hypothetical protein
MEAHHSLHAEHREDGALALLEDQCKCGRARSGAQQQTSRTRGARIGSDSGVRAPLGAEMTSASPATLRSVVAGVLSGVVVDRAPPMFLRKALQQFHRQLNSSALTQAARLSRIKRARPEADVLSTFRGIINRCRRELERAVGTVPLLRRRRCPSTDASICATLPETYPPESST